MTHATDGEDAGFIVRSYARVAALGCEFPWRYERAPHWSPCVTPAQLFLVLYWAAVTTAKHRDWAVYARMLTTGEAAAAGRARCGLGSHMDPGAAGVRSLWAFDDVIVRRF